VKIFQSFDVGYKLKMDQHEDTKIHVTKYRHVELVRAMKIYDKTFLEDSYCKIKT
jgi:hypothetical protein